MDGGEKEWAVQHEARHVAAKLMYERGVPFNASSFITSTVVLTDGPAKG